MISNMVFVTIEAADAPQAEKPLEELQPVQ